jgi:hypothetical protein
MSKTGWTMMAAGFLLVVAFALASTRRSVLGPDIEGEPGWQVTLTVTGELPGGKNSLSLPLPPDFRHQHVSGESFKSKELVPRVPKRRQRARRVVWRRDEAADRPLAYTLTYTFHAQVGMGQPTGGMLQGTRRLDRPPDESHRHAAPLIESTAPPVQDKARELLATLPNDASPIERLQILFDYVDGLDAGRARGARRTLADQRGSSIGKTRLLVALCRSQGIPARLLTGLVLAEDGKRPLHSWAEAWVQSHWVPMDPTDHRFRANAFPDSYLVLNIGDGGYRTPQAKNVQVDCQVQHLSISGDRTALTSSLRTFFLKASLHRLRPAEQHLVRFLLLLPLAALVVSIFRTVIGVPTFGTFAPALLGLAFVDLRALRLGLPIFVLIILLGWMMRHGLERFHLLQVPRAAALLTLIVGVLIALIVVSSNFDVRGMQYISLFPLVILTHLVERFWTIEAEDGTMSSFKTLLGTIVVSVTVSVALGFEALGAWMLSYPETLLGVLAAHLALGRYTGYRLSELYRFGDMVHDDLGAGAVHGVSGANSAKMAAEEGTSSTPDGEAIGTPHAAPTRSHAKDGGT